MEGERAQKPRTIPKPFGRKRKASEPAAAKDKKPRPPVVTESHDRQRAVTGYLAAVEALQKAVQGRHNHWELFAFPSLKLKGELEDLDAAQFKQKLNEVFEARENTMKNRERLAQCGHALASIFTAFSPFAKIFLAIAKDAQSVTCHTYGSLTLMSRSQRSIRTEFSVEDYLSS